MSEEKEKYVEPIRQQNKGRMIEVTLDRVANDFLLGGFYPDGSKHGIKIKYKDWFKTFSAFCEFVKESGYIII